MSNLVHLQAPIARPEASPHVVYLATLAAGPSRDSMRAALKTVAGLLGPVPAPDVAWPLLRWEHLQALKRKLADVYSPNTANRYLAAVRGVLKASWKLGLLDIDTYHRARDTGVVRGSRVTKGRALSDAEVVDLLGAVRNDRIVGARDRAMLAILFTGGLRRAELVGLDLEHLHGSSLRVRGKGNKERVVYMNEDAMTAVRDWLDVRGYEPGPLLLPTGKMGKSLAWRRMSAHAVLATLRTLCKRAGVAKCAPHDCRRTVISNLLDASADIATVQAIAGHSSPAITAKYDRRGEERKVRAAALLRFPSRPSGQQERASESVQAAAGKDDKSHRGPPARR